eukprot:GHVQ01029510.1.p1 GENE.GHVQ01029510.1~~GHVQ01029510.1.p1  ORF type:complete len:554 (+),score=66.56 GHVQ01029510.1:97-1758(+)
MTDEHNWSAPVLEWGDQIQSEQASEWYTEVFLPCSIAASARVNVISAFELLAEFVQAGFDHEKGLAKVIQKVAKEFCAAHVSLEFIGLNSHPYSTPDLIFETQDHFEGINIEAVTLVDALVMTQALMEVKNIMRPDKGRWSAEWLANITFFSDSRKFSSRAEACQKMNLDIEQWIRRHDDQTFSFNKGLRKHHLMKQAISQSTDKINQSVKRLQRLLDKPSPLTMKFFEDTDTFLEQLSKTPASIRSKLRSLETDLPKLKSLSTSLNVNQKKRRNLINHLNISLLTDENNPQSPVEHAAKAKELLATMLAATSEEPSSDDTSLRFPTEGAVDGHGAVDGGPAGNTANLQGAEGGPRSGDSRDAPERTNGNAIVGLRSKHNWKKARARSKHNWKKARADVASWSLPTGDGSPAGNKDGTFLGRLWDDWQDDGMEGLGNQMKVMSKTTSEETKQDPIQKLAYLGREVLSSVSLQAKSEGTKEAVLDELNGTLLLSHLSLPNNSNVPTVDEAYPPPNDATEELHSNVVTSSSADLELAIPGSHLPPTTLSLETGPQ